MHLYMYIYRYIHVRIVLSRGEQTVMMFWISCITEERSLVNLANSASFSFHFLLYNSCSIAESRTCTYMYIHECVYIYMHVSIVHVFICRCQLVLYLVFPPMHDNSTNEMLIYKDKATQHNRKAKQ